MVGIFFCNSCIKDQAVKSIKQMINTVEMSRPLAMRPKNAVRIALPKDIHLKNIYTTGHIWADANLSFF